MNGIDAYLKAQGKYQKSESKITWADVEDCLVLVSNNFSTQTSYENQTKKPSTTSLSRSHDRVSAGPVGGLLH